MEGNTATCNSSVSSNKRHVLCTGERNILKNVYESLRARSPELTVRQLAKLCSDMTKVSVRTIFRILKEKNNACLSVVANKQKPGRKKIVLNNDVKNSIRRKLHTFYSRNEIPSIKKLQHELGNDESLPKISLRVLLRTLREMNIRTKDEYNLTEELDGNYSLETTSINTMPNSAFNRIKIEPNIPENGSMSALDTLEIFESNRVDSENMESEETIEQLGIKDAGTPYTESDIKGNKDVTMSDIPPGRKKIKPDIPENGSMSAVDTLETVESEFSIDRVKLENMESMETIEQLGIKDAGTPYTELDIKGNKDITLSDTPSGRVKSENSIIEMWDRPDFYIVDKMDEIETVDSQVLISGANSEYIDSTELTEQLDTKNKGDTSTLLPESDIKDEDDSSTNISDIAKENSLNTESTHKAASKHEMSYCGGSRNCLHCNATFKRKAELDNHIISRHPDFIASVTSKIHQCTQCTFKTTVISNLNKHQLKHYRIAGGDKPKTCIQCGATFKNKISLDDHIINKHPSFITSVTSKLHECTKCTFKTTIVSNLDRHLLKHPETAGSYKLSECIHCSAVFKSKRTLDNHMMKKHSIASESVTSKIHECTECTFKTTEISNLNRHVLKHSRTAPAYKLTCMHCSTTFKYKRSLDDHIVKKHPSFIASVTSKMYECAKCTYKTTLCNLFKKHLLEHHSTN